MSAWASTATFFDTGEDTSGLEFRRADLVELLLYRLWAGGRAVARPRGASVATAPCAGGNAVQPHGAAGMKHKSSVAVASLVPEERRTYGLSNLPSDVTTYATSIDRLASTTSGPARMRNHIECRLGVISCVFSGAGLRRDLRKSCG